MYTTGLQVGCNSEATKSWTQLASNSTRRMRRATYTLLLAHLKFATAQDKEPFVTIAFTTNFDKPMYDNVDTQTAIAKVVASTAGSSVSPSDVVPCVLSDVMSNPGPLDGGRRRRLFGGGPGHGGGGGETKLQKVMCTF